MDILFYYLVLEHYHMLGCLRKNLAIAYEASKESAELLYFLTCTLCAAYAAHDKKRAMITSSWSPSLFPQ